jgi:Flp pilus assembly pilin Flp
MSAAKHFETGMIMRSQLRRLNANENGAAVMEFAIVAPVFLLLIIGLFDFGHQLYATSVLQGTLQTSAREATLENGFSIQNDIDARIEDNFKTIIPVGDVTVTRRSFEDFSDIVTPEELLTDANGNGFCDAGDRFDDMNGNGNWDQDRGRDGLGGARDAVVFTATATYDRMFPLAGMMDIPREVTIEAETVLRNQPYNEQGERIGSEETC